ncbi:hypothetical protein VTN77DRAFT_9896 [Rasamsonia byssochlamydoides]|uniref:uncharacterized protein n=1 Tax=Rasamsonia byssochlamydoides TaxID=89139 RepID=UPI003742BC46
MGSWSYPEATASAKRLKTVDWGSNGRILSMDHVGTILYLGFYHPQHGVVVLSPYEQFDGTRFYDPTYVRAYRKRMLQWMQDGKPGFGVHVHGEPVDHASVTSRDRRQIQLDYELDGGIHVRRTISVDETTGEVRQTTALSTASSQAVSVPVTLNLGMSLNRASYGQLTEGGPIPIPKSENEFKTARDGSRFSLRNSNLDAAVEGRFWCSCPEGILLDFDVTENTFYDEPVKAESTGLVTIEPGSVLTFTVSFLPQIGNSLCQPFRRDTGDNSCQPCKWRIPDDAASKIILGNLEYILGNCMIPISDQSTCVITDHVALPLGWNRDNYWQVRFLLEVYKNLEQIADETTAKEYREEILRNVRGHLHWVFRDAQRPNRFWHRSYVANGVPKDRPIFQLDQQCYPLLELCDYFELVPDTKEFVSEIVQEGVVADIVDLLDSRRDSEYGLFPTDETPGDDPVEFPFHFSSHVLLWYTFTRVARLVEALGEKTISPASTLHPSRLHNLAEDIFSATMRHFIAVNPKTKENMFAYLTNGAGRHAFYHDANDIPTLFAPEWGFVKTPEDIAIWTRTMQFGLSSANEGGFYGEGPYGGLGSVHTRGPWPLGYFQALVFAEMQGDLPARECAWRRIQGAMFPDGLFSEAVDGQTGECTSKAWFSWPGSMIGAALLRDRSGKVFTHDRALT